MNQIKFLHVFPNLMCASGDAANLDFAAYVTRKMGYDVTIVQTDDPAALCEEEYNLAYIADGSPRALHATAGIITRAGASIARAFDSGKVIFACGSARLLFGNGFITSDGRTGVGLGIFNYSGVDAGHVIMSRNVGVPVFDSSAVVVGEVVRRFRMVGQNTHPLLRLKAGTSDGEELTGVEGTLYRNFFGTWQCGSAVLAENPALAREVLRRALGHLYREPDLVLSTEAHNELLIKAR